MALTISATIACARGMVLERTNVRKLYVICAVTRNAGMKPADQAMRQFTAMTVIAISSQFIVTQRIRKPKYAARNISATIVEV